MIAAIAPAMDGFLAVGLTSGRLRPDGTSRAALFQETADAAGTGPRLKR
jgi:hypothetical protein